MHPDLFENTARELHSDIVPEGVYKNIYTVCLEQSETEGTFTPEHLFSYIDRTEEASLVSGFINTDDRIDREVASKLSEESIRTLKLREYDQEAEKLKKKYREAEKAGNDEMARKYLYQLDVIQKHRKTLASANKKHLIAK
jgi:hypothetical protein